MAKADLLKEAQRLGITHLSMRNSISQIEAAIRRRAEQTEQKRWPVSVLMDNSVALFGQPRSVLVGAISAGFIEGDEVTKTAAAEGIQKFLEYGGK